MKRNCRQKPAWQPHGKISVELIRQNSEPQARQDYLAIMMRLALSTTNANVRESVDTALRRSGEYYGADRVYAYRLNDDDTLHLTAEWTRKGVEPLDDSSSTLPANAIGRWRDALENGTSVNMPPGTRFPQIPKGVAFLVPMNGEDGLTGLLGIENLSPVMLDSKEEQRFLGIIAVLIQTTMRRLVDDAERDEGLSESGSVHGDPGSSGSPSDTRDFAFEIDAEGRLQRIDSPVRSLSGKYAKGMLGALIEEVFPSPIARDIRRYLGDVDRKGPISNRTVEVKTPTHSLWYALSASVLPTEPGEAANYRLVLRDVTLQIDPADETVHLGQIVGMMTNLVEIVDPRQRIVWTNRAFEKHTGHVLEDIRGLDLSDLLMGEGSNRETSQELRQAISEGRGYEGENINYSKDGTPYWVTFNMRPLNDAAGHLTGFVFVETIITKRRQLESSLRAERDFLSALSETSVSAVVACDAAGKAVFANSEARKLLQRKPQRRFPRTSAWPLSPVGESADEQQAAPFRQVMKTGTKVRAMTLALTHPGEQRRILSVNAAPLTDGPTGARVIITLTDITTQYEAEEIKRLAAAQALHDAEHEQLTGLPNRRQLTRRLASAIKEDAKAKARLYVAVIDLDRFKSIKTFLGHDIGDDLLRAVGTRLGQVAGPKVMLACIGGDCFVAFVRGGHDEVEDLLSRLRTAIAEPYDLHQTNIFVTASIGVTCHENPDDTAETLIRQAEMASHNAKALGGNRHAFHNREMEIRFSRRGDIVQAMRQALQRDEFELAFQPKFALADGYPHIGAEALLRWNSSALGWIGPAEFIPVAEASGLISEIDFHVMRIFARQLGIWQRAGILVPASMNLSPLSFENPTLAPQLIALLADETVSCGDVTIEITETSLVSSSRNAIQNIDLFKQAGIRLSIDDFGTGYSSLSYLQRLIVSELKIDKSFVQKLGAAHGPGNSEVIVRTILTLARSLGVSTVAEGVETTEQLNWLRREGCDVIQGFLGGKAANPEIYQNTVLRRGTLFDTICGPPH